MKNNNQKEKKTEKSILKHKTKNTYTNFKFRKKHELPKTMKCGASLEKKSENLKANRGVRELSCIASDKVIRK